MHTHTHTNLCTYAPTHTYIYTHMPTYIHTYIYIYTYIQPYTYAYIYTYTYMHTRTYTYIYPLIYVYTCRPLYTLYHIHRKQIFRVRGWRWEERLLRDLRCVHLVPWWEVVQGHAVYVPSVLATRHSGLGGGGGGLKGCHLG